MIVKPGMYQLTLDEYHKGPGVSSSHIKELSKSPAHYKAWLDRDSTKSSDEMRIGSAVHCLVLEPHEFQNCFGVAPKCDKRTNLGKETWNNFAAANVGKIIITEDQYEVVKKVVEAINTKVGGDPDLQELLIGHKEQSFYWNDPETGILCRCRPDVLTEIGIITDLKTTEDASANAFQHAIAKSNYYVQAAFYLDGIRYAVEQAGLQSEVPKLPEYFVLIAAEKEAPHEIGIYSLDELALSEGRKRYQAALKKLQPCLASKVWPGYERRIESITLPNWAFYTR